MDPSVPTVALNKKQVVAIGIFVLVIVLAGAYFLLGGIGTGASNQNNLQGGSSKTTEADYAIASSAAQQRNENLLSEGETKTYRGQTMEVVRISQDSVLVKVGSETKIVGSGKEASFGNLAVKVLSISYSGDAEFRKAIIRMGDSATASGIPSNQTHEFTLSEGESASEGSFVFTVTSIGRDSVAIAFGQEGRTIFNGQWERIGNLRVEIKSIFYTGDVSESKVVILVTKLSNG